MPEPRQKLSPTGDVMATIVTMSEGNPGAISVLTQMIKDRDEVFIFLLGLDDMNIRGTQIWMGYKDHCGEDIAVFEQAIADRDSEMVDLINLHGMLGNHDERAVTGGASYNMPPRFTEEEKEKALEEFNKKEVAS